MRLNPRQRREEDRSVTIAGLRILDLAEFAFVLAPGQIMALEDRDFMGQMADINGAVVRGVAAYIKGELGTWKDEGVLKLRRGRGDEISIIAKDCSNFRSWLTEVALGLDEKNPIGSDGERSPRYKHLRVVLDMLEASSDRRENTWDYRDKSYVEMRALPWAKTAFTRRREAILSDMKFRKMLDRYICEARGAKR